MTHCSFKKGGYVSGDSPVKRITILLIWAMMFGVAHTQSVERQAEAGQAIRSQAQLGTDSFGGYAIDFSIHAPAIVMENRQKAVLSGKLVEQESGKLTNKPYQITVELSGGPATSRVVGFLPAAGLGETRFAKRKGPQLITVDGKVEALEVALLGMTGKAVSEDGAGLNFFRGPSSQAVVTVNVGKAYNISRLKYQVMGVDGYISGESCAVVKPDSATGSAGCLGTYADRIKILSDSANWMLKAVDAERVMTITNRAFPKFQDQDNSGRPDKPEDKRASSLLDPASRIDISHFGSVGSQFAFRFNDWNKPLDSSAAAHPAYDAPSVSIGLGSRITFDLSERAPVVLATDPNIISISGYVFADANGNGVKDSGEGAAETQEVRVYEAAHYGEATSLASVTVDAEGRYQLDNLRAGTAYRVEAMVTPQPASTAIGRLRAIRLIKRFTPERDAGNRLDFAAWPQALNQLDAQQTDLLLPDLMPFPVSPDTGSSDPEWDSAMSTAFPTIKQWTMDTKSFPGRAFIRFGTTAFNRGKGPLHLVGGPEQGGQQIVYQRMYTENGSYQDRVAGLFVYHPTHDHIHVDGFEAYNLRDIETDRILASSGKVSFCLANIDWGEATRAFSDRDKVALAFTGWECDKTEQSINTGYGDYYEPHLPFQWIDVTTVPSGQYWLEIRVDPSDVLLESDESNNAVRIKIDLENPLH